MDQFDVIVIGAGHAGCEAALAAARRGSKTLLLTQSVEKIGAMSCNPAIGGTAKGHLVKEIDAMGGSMGKAIDATGIQFRVLNRKKGPAIWSSRAQADMELYARFMKREVETTAGLSLRQDTVEELVIDDSNGKPKVVGVTSRVFGTFRADSVVITTGTFLNGLIHIGDKKQTAGRAGDPASVKLASFIRDYGFEVGRLKTGTTPRLDGRTIDWEKLEVQHSDPNIIPFSFSNSQIKQELVPCYITHTNEKTHEIIEEYLHQSPLYSGEITGIGPRYCPSIEDKVVKFPDRIRHQVFLEPQGYDTCEVYPNGLSTSLPVEAQYKFIRSVVGLENAEIIRPGYAIEYDYVEPTQLRASLETKLVDGLFLAGQINGTTGYEEAGAQGLIAGANASLKVQGLEPFVLSRSEAYAGVLVDDLITKGTQEPYRMFTSRAEHRLFLREDNADLRLTQKARGIGLVNDHDFEAFEKRKLEMQSTRLFVEQNSARDVSLDEQWLMDKDNKGLKLATVIKRSGLEFLESLGQLEGLAEVDPAVLRRVCIEVKYEGYISREGRTIQSNAKLEKWKIPEGFTYASLQGLSHEVIEKLSKSRPENLGQASRISGITPAALQILRIQLARAVQA